MICGAKRYSVEAIINEELKNVRVHARTPAEARKRLRAKYGRDTEITAVKEIYSSC